MDPKTAALKIGERPLKESAQSLESVLNELSGFYGNTNKTLRAFHEEFRRKRPAPEKFDRVSRLLIVIASLRNELLHPTLPPLRTEAMPKNELSKSELEDLLSRLKELNAIVSDMM